MGKIAPIANRQKEEAAAPQAEGKLQYAVKPLAIAMVIEVKERLQGDFAGQSLKVSGAGFSAAGLGEFLGRKVNIERALGAG